jgi:hypothetical protein
MKIFIASLIIAAVTVMPMSASAKVRGGSSTYSDGCTDGNLRSNHCAGQFLQVAMLYGN